MTYPINKIEIGKTFPMYFNEARKKLDNDLLLQKPVTMPRPPEKPQLNISTQDLFRLRKQ